MSTLQHDLGGAAVLDLFAGSGALGLEALSRGAARVTFVERAGAALRALQQNIDTLGAHAETDVVKTDAVKYAAALEAAAYDIAFADPPYDTDEAERLLAVYAQRPFARILCLEHHARAALTLPDGAQTRRYGDTAITFITAPA